MNEDVQRRFTTTGGATALVDRDELRAEVRAKYAAVAEEPDATYHFHTGYAAAQRCRYDMAAVDELPVVAVESFAGVGNPSVVEFDWEAGTPLVEHLSKGKIQGTAWGVALLSDGTVAAAIGGNGGFVLFWKQDGKEEFHQVKLPNTARDLALSPDGLHLTTAHHDGHLRIHKMDAKA